jgi:hypothetical protein
MKKRFLIVFSAFLFLFSIVFMNGALAKTGSGNTGHAVIAGKPAMNSIQAVGDYAEIKPKVETVSLTLDTDNNYYTSTVVFQAERQGTFSFHSITTEDTDIFIRNAASLEVAADKDDGQPFDLDVELDAGQTYQAFFVNHSGNTVQYGMTAPAPVGATIVTVSNGFYSNWFQDIVMTCREEGMKYLEITPSDPNATYDVSTYPSDPEEGDSLSDVSDAKVFYFPCNAGEYHLQIRQKTGDVNNRFYIGFEEMSFVNTGSGYSENLVENDFITAACFYAEKTGKALFTTNKSDVKVYIYDASLEKWLSRNKSNNKTADLKKGNIYLVVFYTNGKPGSITYGVLYKSLGATSKITAKKASKTSIQVSWKHVAGAYRYEIYRSTKKSSGFKKLKVLTGSSYINTGLSKKKQYYYKVRAVSSANGHIYKGPWSKVVSVKL